MKKVLIIALILFLTCPITVFAQETLVLKSGISMIDSVPKQFFGMWAVKSKLVSTNELKQFRNSGVDVWNLRRSGNVIELSNPMTGAVAEIYMKEVADRKIVFSHSQREGSYKITDIVTLELNENEFTGQNELKYETIKVDEKGRYYTEVKKATYDLYGKKMSGQSIN